MRKIVNFGAAAVIMGGSLLILADSQPVAATQGLMDCTTPSGGECTAEACCVIDDACFDKCPVPVQELQ